MKAVFAFLLLAAALAACASPSGPEFTPPPALPEGWAPEGVGAVYNGAELYGYINGGAEVYLELGFDHVEVRPFRKGEAKVSLDIYHMKDPLAALGIYLMSQGRASRSHPDFMVRNTIHPYQLQFVKGSAYVQVTNATETPNAERVMLAFGRHAAHEIPLAGAGDPFTALPLENRVPGSERIVRGPFTLERIYVLGDGDILQLNGRTTAYAADFSDESGGLRTLLVADYPDREEAGAAFDHIKTHLDPYLEVISQSEDTLAFKDYDGNQGEVNLDNVRIHLRIQMVQ